MVRMVVLKPINAPNVMLPVEQTADVLLLPREVAAGQGLYDDSVVILAKELRAAGASAEYQHGPDAREWIGEKHVPVIVVDIIAGIASNAGWDGLRAVVGRHKSDQVRVRVTRVKQTLAGEESEWYEVEGPGAEVAEALKTLQEQPAASSLNEGDGQGT
jgi:hypothetical protein